MGITVPLTILAVVAPQHPQPSTPAVPTAVLIANTEELAPAVLGLGQGGMTKNPSRAVDASLPGRATTPGGLLVRAASAGVKLDFASGVEALIAPDGFLHFRDGGAAGPFAGGVEFAFADGSRLQVHCSPTSRTPLREVLLADGDRVLRLWRRNRTDDRWQRRRAFHGPSFLVCGNGDVLYRAVTLGPLVVLERGPCSKAAADRWPAARIAIAAGPLTESLRALPRRFPKPTTEYPEVDRLAAELAVLAPSMFARPGRELEPVVHNALHFGLSRRFSLSIDPAGSGPLRLGLHAGGRDEPLAEWSLGTYSELHLLNPKRGEEGAPRYYRRGIPLPEPAVRPDTADLAEARRILRSLLRAGPKTR